MDDFYKILEVSENATQDEIKKNYRKLSLLHHPDKNPGNTEAENKFKSINEAYQILGDNEERERYDMNRRNPFGGGNMRPGMQSGMHPGAGHMDDIFKMFFGGGMPGMGGGMPGMGGGMPPGMGGFPGGNVRIFRNGQAVDVNALNRPPPIVKNVVISLEQAYKGDQIAVQIDRWIFEDGIRKCENETLYITINKGVDDKEIIILREKGNVLDSQLKGDVKLIITIQNSTMFKREGLNLIMEKEISLKESICGFEFIINHLSGKQLRYTSEECKAVKDGVIKSIPNYGMERDSHKGHLCIKFNVKYPDKFTLEQIEQLKEIL